MNSPIQLRQQLALRLIASVDIPELREQHQTAESLDAARVYGQRVGFWRARLVVWDDGTGVVLVALVVE